MNLPTSKEEWEKQRALASVKNGVDFYERRLLTNQGLQSILLQLYEVLADEERAKGRQRQLKIKK